MASQQSYRFLNRLGRSASLLKKTCSRSSHLSAALLTRASYPHFPAVSLVSTKRYLSSSGETFSLINIQDVEDFQKRVKESTVPVVVDFHATWCGPCKLLGPRLESIVAGKEGKVVLAKIDIDNNTDIAMEYDVKAVPTVLSFKNGKIIDKFTGLQDDDKIKSFVETLIH